MADAAQVTALTNGDTRRTIESAIGAYEVQCGNDGRAEVYSSATAGTSGTQSTFKTEGTYNLTKTTGIELLKGGPVWWDFSANSATYRKTDDRDFYVGTAALDAASSDSLVTVNLNVPPTYLIDLARDPFATVIVGTQALGGLGLYRRGGKHKMLITATNEAQKLDMLSDDGFALGANAIAEFEINVVDDGASTAVDVNFGLASATHATDADSIAQHLFFHLDENVVNILVQSKDGTTTVAATDTTADYTLGTRFHCWIDMRDPTAIRWYVNGVRMLSATTFNVNAGASTWKLLVHVEKTATTDTYEIDIDSARVRIAEQ